jgi:NAD(P)-dependent dehydrogenase (short-subunit alcohol dehydrogenase family)
MSIQQTPVAVVSGAAGGIGASCAIRLARDGFDIVIADLKAAAETKAIVDAVGRRCEIVGCDVTDPSGVQALCEHVGTALGRCDVLLNAAGVYSMVPLDALTFESWRRFMAVNLDSAFLMCKAFVPMMRERRYGRLISIASNSFYSNVPGMIAYVATKGGLIGLMRGLASELGGDGITANIVAPGPILTDQLKSMVALESGVTADAAVAGFFSQITATQAVKRTGMPSDVAGVVSFLAGDQTGFVTGQTIVVDGGSIRL